MIQNASENGGTFISLAKVGNQTEPPYHQYAVQTMIYSQVFVYCYAVSISPGSGHVFHLPVLYTDLALEKTIPWSPNSQLINCEASG